MGPVKKAAVIHEKRTAATPEGEWPASRGFGYVTFALAGDAARCVTMLHGKVIRGRKISVTVSEKKPTQQELKAAKAAKQTKAAEDSTGTSRRCATIAPMLWSSPCRYDPRPPHSTFHRIPPHLHRISLPPTSTTRSEAG